MAAVQGKPHRELNLETRPSCRHSDYKSGFLFYSDGFTFHCFHIGCEYNQSTGWSKDTFVGRRVCELYELLGGNKEDLILNPHQRQYRADARETADMIRNPDKYFAISPTGQWALS